MSGEEDRERLRLCNNLESTAGQGDSDLLCLGDALDVILPGLGEEDPERLRVGVVTAFIWG